MNVCAVIVTYNNRFNLLKQVIDGLFRINVQKIIVVDNNSEDESRSQLINLEKNNVSRLKVLYLNENTGSAGGYARGLREFYDEKSCDFVWLLDDDNVPKEDSFEVIRNFWSSLTAPDKESSIALLSSRPGRKIYETAVIQNNPDLVIGDINGFMGFTVTGFFSRIARSFFKKEAGSRAAVSHGNVAAAYYGGLFFHKSLLDIIGYPNEDLFVYSDDIEYSNRIVRKGGKIIVLFNSRIDDVDEKWHSPEDKITCLKLPLMNESNKHRFYYQIRNRIYFEKYRTKSSSLLYSFNKFVYFVILKVVLLTNKNISYSEIIKLAIKDGLKGNLGKKDTAYLG